MFLTEASITYNMLYNAQRQLTLRGLPRPLLTTSVAVLLLEGLTTTLLWILIAESCSSGTWVTRALEFFDSFLPASKLRRIRLKSTTALWVSSSRWSARRLRTDGLLCAQHGHAFVNSLPGEDLGLWTRLRELLRLFLSETAQPERLRFCLSKLLLHI